MALTRRKAKRVAKRYWPLAVAAAVVLALAGAWIAAPASEWAESLSREIGELGMVDRACDECAIKRTVEHTRHQLGRRRRPQAQSHRRETAMEFGEQ